MKTPVRHVGIVLVLLTLIVGIASSPAQGTAFTYQGRLNNGGAPASGVFDLTFTVYNVNSNGLPWAGPVTNSATMVTNGLFTSTIDFGPGVFNGANYWLEIGVRTNGGGAFAPLTPRQAILPTPYAIMANSASNLLGTLSASQVTGPIPASQLSGTIPSANLSGAYSGALNLNNGANMFDGTFIGQFIGSSFLGGTFTGQFLGDGSGLVNINPAHISGQVAYLNSNQVFTAQNYFSQGIGIGLTNLNPFFEIDAQGNQSNTRFTTTNNGYGAVMELRNLTTNDNEYIGAINFNNYLNYYPGQIGYIAVTPTNIYDDYFEFRVAGTIGWRLQGDARGMGAASIIGGYPGNSIDPISGGSTIAGGGYGGGYNTVYSNSPGVFIGAGSGNQVGPNANDSVIAGGFYNNIQAGDSLIAGGFENSIATNATYSSIGGGYQNVLHPYAFVVTMGGGSLNHIYGNSHDATNSIIVGHTIAGGAANTIQAEGSYSTIGGGLVNTIFSNNFASIIAGGDNNTIRENNSVATIGGGYFNAIYSVSPYAVIAGGSFNAIQTNSQKSAIGGGGNNTVYFNAPGSTIGGGENNFIQQYADHSVISGGQINAIQFAAWDSFIGGGSLNTIQTNAHWTVLVGGNNNTISNGSDFAFIGGGSANQVGAPGGVVPGGYNNLAAGTNSFAAGTQAQATNDGSFVLADLQYTNFYSTTSNQLSARFSGGVRFETAGAGVTIDGQPVLSTTGGNGSALTNVNAATLDGFSSNGFIQNQSGSPQVASFNISGTAMIGNTATIVGNISGRANAAFNTATVTNNLTAGSLTSSNVQFTGLIRSGSETGTAQPPFPAGLVVRRINSTDSTSNSIVAVGHTFSGATLTLTRDNTTGGFQIHYPAAPGLATIACMGIDTNGIQRNFYQVLTNPPAAGVVQIYSNSQGMGYFHCSFGDPYSESHLTEVTLTRYANDFYWVGQVVSTVNQ